MSSRLGASASRAALRDPQFEESQHEHFTPTRNACKLCTPLGACLVFRGIEGTIPFLHGAQGCSTYIRRYLISHFREPIDIAASHFSEESAVFGGRKNFTNGIKNVIRQYQLKMIAIATTCLSETIGEDMNRMVREYLDENWYEGHPHLVNVSTPSYSGTHVDGFRLAVRAVVERLAAPGPRTQRVALFPGMLSASDLRHLKEIVADFGLPLTLLAALEAGAFRLRLADTVGILTPGRAARMIESIAIVAPGLELEFHGHNDLGMAVANTVAALEAGAHAASVTVNGLGERAGNAALEEVVMALRVGCGIESGIDTRGFFDLSQLVARSSGRVIHDSKPVTGKTAFLHESGIHYAGLLRDRATYEPFPSSDVGRDGSGFVVGHHSNVAMLADLCRRAGLGTDGVDFDALLTSVRSCTGGKKTPVDLGLLRTLVAELKGTT